MIKYFKKLSILAFFNFTKYLNEQITANAPTWGIPITKAVEIDTAYNTYKPYYDAIVNKKSRTPQQVDDHAEQRILFENIIEPFANQYIIPNALISNSEVEVLGFNRKQQGGFRPAIDSAPTVSLQVKQGSRIQVENRVESDQTRPSVHKDADAVETRYTLTIPAGSTPPTTPGTPSGGPATTPAYAYKLSKKAKFILQLTQADAGKIITMQARWVNLTDETKSGPWGNPATAMVSW